VEGLHMLPIAMEGGTMQAATAISDTANMSSRDH
jgi:hypothetical protein